MPSFRYRPRYRTPVPNIPGPEVAGVPSVDDDELEVMRKAEAGPYPDWLPELTLVVREPPDRFETAAEAMEHFARLYGRVYQNLSDARWWAARVRRP